ncbi:DUF1803 domain-containing protein [Streptococcus infantarius subsp. infantarius]|uniref:DUF1803 domain-containing protein n=1 Tax=Streptococcus infantarius TaxID=102684 RepID=UPI001BDA20FE|nr:DUF1803 domain-containing protein [Streptococcus infantarius]MBT0896775.1 DUF1803 domain-containing protein [Streptococcus infantarius subsp. infantarius]MBT0899620.1 DUF1803 domain-containing protein [Streptococcus infantarius subsp. infantarius]MBT1033261.1 DUF1803 domain-containing protein [Streptococcus infantarius subsp. infantarius]MCO4603094.1 hypothetical protein [Streptococcus infantarius subsp. infantarius]MCO4608535.1 hypothetical protein [Streptococcus infantarius subsp. infanta
MIIIFNPDKLTRQTFFKDLVNFLYQTDDVTLRQIKAKFQEVPKNDRLIEEYVQAGYIIRDNKRYTIGIELLNSLENISLDSQIFVDDESQIYTDLMKLTFETRLDNEANDLILVEKTSIVRDELTLSNYFFKLAENLPMSKAQEVLFDLLGDVNPQYALKYMTTFLLKFARKDEVAQKRPDIFVEALEKLDYIRKNDQDKYQLNMTFDKETLIFTSK